MAIQTDSYTDAGIWSRVTFRRLNPVFERDRNQKLKLHHVPSVPPSERAENASSLLEESFQKQMMEDSSLPKAIIRVVWKSLAVNAGLAGLTTTYGLNLNVLQAWVIWNLCNVENKMISVKRILQYTDIPSEAPQVIEDCRPSLEWPIVGKIELENLHVQYDPTLPMVLKGIRCTFLGQKKIGVVGRTGSRKSTLIQAIFRVVEPSVGHILIDGVDISKIGLQDLRSRLGIIPQDPTLFQGTMRTNLDPLKQHSDKEIWEVLNQCRLAEVVRQDQRLLDAPVAEDGENWSVGQRQLVSGMSTSREKEDSGVG